MKLDAGGSQKYLRPLEGFKKIRALNDDVLVTDMNFEAVSATTDNENYVYENSPQPNGAFNFLYRNDRQGFASPNTGFFFYFKQGSLQAVDFNLAERISNRVVNINVEGINNDDVWLYQLDAQGNIDQ